MSWSADLDNLTHALVGAAISKAGAERATPLATATLVIAANAPDIDVLSYARGEYFALAFRRGLTHGWPALLVLPLLVAGAVLGWDRWVRRRRNPDSEPARAGPILALSAIGLATHSTLDWMNTYGLRWGLPFDGAWSYGDALFIIDPWIWLALGGAVFLASDPGRLGLAGWGVLAALTSAVVVVGIDGTPALLWSVALAGIIAFRLKRGPGVGNHRAHAAAGTILAVAVYVLAMIGANTRARSHVIEAAEASGLDVQDVMVAPRRGDPFTAEVEILTESGYVPGTHRWFSSPHVRLRPGATVPLFSASGVATEALGRRIATAARKRTLVRNYLVWSRYPYVRVTPDDAGWTVRFSDARYDSQPGAAGLAGVTVHVSSSEIQ